MGEYKKYIAAFLVIFFLISVLFFYLNFLKKQATHQNSALSLKNPGSLVNKISQTKPSQQIKFLSPEETFEEFRLAMIALDVEKALLFINPEKRDLYRSVYKQKEMAEFFKTVSDYKALKKNEKKSDDKLVVCYYFINNDLFTPYNLVMIKNIEGTWEIESV